MDALSNGDYKYWEIATKGEEIYKSEQTDTMKVYKIEVANANEKHVLFYQQDGKLLKDNKVT